MSCLGKSVFVLLLFAGIGWAQTSASNDQETIRLLLEQVRDLQERVKALESKQAHSPAVAETAPPAAEPVQPGTELAAQESLPGPALHDVSGIQWRGFAEVNYTVLDQRQPELGKFGFTPGSAGNFFTGDVDLFLTSRIDDKTSVLAEIVFGEGEAQSFDVDLERMLLKYDYDDHLKLSFGRYHTSIGYYNTAFHTGRWLQTTVDRPLVMEFANDGGLLPTQAIGISATGLIPSGRFGLNYILEYGSGDTNRPDIDGSGAIDEEQNGNGVNLGLFLRPPGVPGLDVGGSYYHDKITNSNLQPPVRYGQGITNLYVTYVQHGFEFLNEGFLIRHVQENGPDVFNTPAFYSQLSKRFGHIRPFFRYQYANASARGFYEDVLLRYGPSLGARYDFNDSVAFKTQLDHTARKGKPALNGLQMQLAFTF